MVAADAPEAGHPGRLNQRFPARAGVSGPGPVPGRPGSRKGNWMPRSGCSPSSAAAVTLVIGLGDFGIPYPFR